MITKRIVKLIQRQDDAWELSDLKDNRNTPRDVEQTGYCLELVQQTFIGQQLEQSISYYHSAVKPMEVDVKNTHMD